MFLEYKLLNWFQNTFTSLIWVFQKINAALEHYIRFFINALAIQWLYKAFESQRHTSDARSNRSFESVLFNDSNSW